METPREKHVFGSSRMDPHPPDPELRRFPEPRKAAVPEELRRGVDGKVRLGECYKTAGKYVIDHEGELVHGTIKGVAKSSGEPAPAIDHAWVEVGDAVYDGTQGQFYERADYYSKMGVDPASATRYNRDQALARMLETEHFGPWEA